MFGDVDDFLEAVTDENDADSLRFKLVDGGEE